MEFQYERPQTEKFSKSKHNIYLEIIFSVFLFKIEKNISFFLISLGVVSYKFNSKDNSIQKIKDNRLFSSTSQNALKMISSKNNKNLLSEKNIILSNNANEACTTTSRVQSSKNNLLEAKKNTIKLLRESHISPFEKIDDLEKFKLRVRSSERVNKVFKNNVKNKEKEFFINNKVLDIQALDINSNGNCFSSTNSNAKLLKPFELEKENFELLFSNNKNKIEFFNQIKKPKTSQTKKSPNKYIISHKCSTYISNKVLNYKSLSTNTVNDANYYICTNKNPIKKDILTQYNSIISRESMLKKTCLTSLKAGNFENQIKSLKSLSLQNKKSSGEKKLYENIILNTKENETINKKDFFNSCSSKKNISKRKYFLDNKDSDMMYVNTNDVLRADDILKSDKKQLSRSGSTAKSYDETELGIDIQNKDIKDKFQKKQKKKDFEKVYSYLNRICGPSKSKFEKRKNKILELINSKKLNYLQESEYQIETKDFIKEEENQDALFIKEIRKQMNEVVLENFSTNVYESSLAIYPRIKKFTDDAYAVPYFNSKMVYTKVIDCKLIDLYSLSLKC